MFNSEEFKAALVCVVAFVIGLIVVAFGGQNHKRQAQQDKALLLNVPSPAAFL